MSQPAASSTPTDFDPTAGVFIAMQERPAHLSDVDLAALAPLQRALLTIDGTVTQFIAAWEMEPVIVRVIDQQPGTAGQMARWLDCAVAAPVLHRAVTLVGRRTGRVFAFAESVLVLDRLPAGMRAALDSEPSGLGKILLNSALESRREALWFGAETLREPPPGLDADQSCRVLTRAYRIIAGERPLMLITERFPVAVSAPPAADIR